MYNHCHEDALSNSAHPVRAEERSTTQALVPAIVLGGAQNALSVARNLARHGIQVFALNYPHEAVRFSRYARYMHLDGDGSPNAWERFLLGHESDHLCGSVLMACSDEAISIIIKNFEQLSRKFLLEETDVALRRDLLDKFTIYQRAQEAGIPTVGYWVPRSSEELDRSMPELRFPLVMKPLYSPQARILKSKAMLIPDRTALTERFSASTRLGVSVVLMEYIPGGDDRLCSYYTYLDEHGNPLVHFTKRTPRRFPLQSGDGTYHIIEWVPEAAELGLHFFRHLKYRGLGNIEFKWDERDGGLKIIEVNARFTASDPLITRSGVNLGLIAYNRITGRPQPPVLDYEQSLVMCRPIEDALAAWELRKRGEMRFSEWINEIRRTNQLPFFEWLDPMPAIAVLGRRIWRLGNGLQFVRENHRSRVGTESA